jgi:hypothetical protein
MRKEKTQSLSATNSLRIDRASAARVRSHLAHVIAARTSGARSFPCPSNLITTVRLFFRPIFRTSFVTKTEAAKHGRSQDVGSNKLRESENSSLLLLILPVATTTPAPRSLTSPATRKDSRQLPAVTPFCLMLRRNAGRSPIIPPASPFSFGERGLSEGGTI